MIRIHVEIRDKTHPEYKNIDKLAEVKVNHLSVLFNRETIAMLIHWFANFLPSDDEIDVRLLSGSSYFHTYILMYNQLER